MRKFVPDHRTVDQLSIEELREIVSSPAFKKVAVQLGSDEEVDYDRFRSGKRSGTCS